MAERDPRTAPASDLVSARQAADALGLTHQHVLRLAKEGRLCPIKVGELTTFDRSDVTRLAAARRMAPDRPGPKKRPKEPAL